MPDQHVEPSAPGHILVVEDEASVRQVVQWALEDENLPVEMAVDGQDAVEQASQKKPALVILDMGLPRLDGFGVAAALRGQYGDTLPILVVTADGRARDKALQVGAYAFLHKPFDIDLLIRRVHDGLNLPSDTNN